MRTKVERMPVSGGLLGALLTNPRRRLAKIIDGHALEGWHLTALTPLSGANVFMVFLSLVVLVCTLGLWTFGAGYLLAFEKSAP